MRRPIMPCPHRPHLDQSVGAAHGQPAPAEIPTTTTHEPIKEQDIKATALEGSVSNERRRIDGAIFLGAGVLAISAYATYLGQPAIAIPFGLAGIATLVLRLLTRQKRED